MTEEEEKGEISLTALAEPTVPRVTRSAVPTGKDYTEYRNYLRHDFYYTCAYCQICEAEASAIRFTIDHYEPQKAKPELAHEYSNLMYACDKCNQLKGDRCPPDDARARGHRFYRMDVDIYSEHFKIDGIRLKDVSPTGYYTIQSLDLNRQALRRLREYRRRMADCDALVAEGLLGLKHFHMDRLPPFMRGQVLSAIKDANGMVNSITNAIDDFLRENMRSPLVDDDPEFGERAKARASALKGIMSLSPENWHAPRNQPTSKKK